MRASFARFDALLVGALALLAGAAAIVGIVARGGAWSWVTSVRGEAYQATTDGVYAWNAQRIVAEGIGWDLFTLLIVVPALLLVTPHVARGSFRGRLFTLGGLGYLGYQYLEYAVTWAFGPLLPLFVAIVAGTVLAMVALTGGLVADRLAGRSTWAFGEAFPGRAWAGLSLAMCALLTVLWLGRIMQGLTQGVDGLLLGETTMTVQALDLGLVVPLTALSAVGAWRGSQVGRAYAAVVVVTFVAMSGAITSMLLAAWVVEGVLELPPVLIFAAAVAAAAATGLRMYRSATLALAPAPARPELPGLAPSARAADLRTARPT